ncbi:hypothetical protein C1N53_04240 [Pontibacter sp. SGAir0037]|nr:hypothetical protein C1N53_04240 [Pontibacter sp. SGAir0037]
MSDSEQETDRNAQTDSTAELAIGSSDTSRQLKNIEDIRKEYSRVISMAEKNSLDSSFFNYDCYGEKKGRVVFFSDEEGLRLIRHTYNEYSHFSATDEYFVKDSSLFFAFYHHVSWRFEGEGETRDDVTEKRFYLLHGKALKCLEKKFTVKSSSSGNLQPEMVANKETDCSSLEAVLDKFDLLTKYKGSATAPSCLE